MRRRGLFAKLKSTLLGTAIFSAFSFGFQSIALPIHSVSHEVRREVIARSVSPNSVSSSSGSTRLVEGDCDLCDFVAHQAIRVSPISTTLVAIETLSSRAELPRESVSPLSFRNLPPARGPPERA